MFQAKTAAEINQRLKAEVKAQLPGADPWIWPNNLNITLKVIAQAIRAVELRLEWLHRQSRTATAEDFYLEQHGIDVGVTRLSATFASGTVRAGTVPGTIIPADTMMTRTDRAIFLTTRWITAIAAVTVLPVRAEVVGRGGNTESGATFQLVTPIVGVNNIIVEDDGIGGGEDEENLESLRTRILRRKANPPRGGSPSEYTQWARTKPGVRWVWVRRATPKPGSVTIYFMMYDSFVTGVPPAAHVLDLQLRLERLAPADARVIAAAPTPLLVDIVIRDLVPNTQPVIDAVTAEIHAMFRRRAEPGSPVTDFLFSRSWISEAISQATNETRHTLEAPAADITCGDGIIAATGTISFTFT